MNREIIALDLFAGCGGLTHGLQGVGVYAKWANENDKHAAETYRTSHSGTHVFEEDIQLLFQRILDGDDGVPKKGSVELLIGGPPCQGFSGYNRFRSLRDPRNSLVENFLDYVDFLRPRFVLLENVPGMLSLDKGKIVHLLLDTFETLGYNSNLGILQAGYYGLPQNRWRVFIWAALKGELLPMFPEPTHIFPRTTIFGAKEFREFVVLPPSSEPTLFWSPLPRITVKDTISDLPVIVNGGGKDVMAYNGLPESQYQEKLRAINDELFDHRCVKLGKESFERCCHIPKKKGAGWLDLPDDLKPKNLIRHGDNRYPNRFGRLYWEGNFNTILTRPEPYWGRVFHPTQDRVISVRECARAQGFPDKFRFSGPQSRRYKQIGNAVPPPLAKALGKELVKVICKD
jgi:DNA (cytosine-5)-methyltransferase 1